MMLRRRIEKLEARLPEPAGKLMERIERQSLNALCPQDRELASEVFRTNRRRKVWSPAQAAAIERYSEFCGQLLEDVSLEDLVAMRLRLEKQCGRPIREVLGIA
jgi:hypothetical protein